MKQISGNRTIAETNIDLTPLLDVVFILLSGSKSTLVTIPVESGALSSSAGSGWV